MFVKSFFESFLFYLFTIITKEEKGNCGHIEGKVKLPKDYNISGRIYNELFKFFYKNT